MEDIMNKQLCKIIMCIGSFVVLGQALCCSTMTAQLSTQPTNKYVTQIEDAVSTIIQTPIKGLDEQFMKVSTDKISNHLFQGMISDQKTAQKNAMLWFENTKPRLKAVNDEILKCRVHFNECYNKIRQSILRIQLNKSFQTTYIFHLQRISFLFKIHETMKRV